MMADTEQQLDDSDEDGLRRRLINRIALAGVAIVALLGGLAVIDGMYVAPTPAPTKVAALPDAIKPMDAIPISPVATGEPMDQAVPEPPKPEAIPTIKSVAEPEKSSSPSARLPRQATPLAGPGGTNEAKSALVRPLTQSAQGERRFVLQMGVFNNLDNAQELLAQLQKSGVPAQIEARVQVGPFKTKAEADQARTRLKAMGLDTGLLMAIRR